MNVLKLLADCQTTATKVCIDAGHSNVPKVAVDDNTLGNVLGATFIVIGSICVLYIIIGGIRYTTSGGDPTGITRAKDTILYAVVGMVVSLAAFTIVQLVLGVF